MSNQETNTQIDFERASQGSSALETIFEDKATKHDFKTDGKVSSRASTPTENEVYESFDDMGLNTKLLRGIYGYGFERPSAIQQQAIVPIVSGRDVLAQAQSGTGKTATFCIGLLQSLDLNSDAGSRLGCQALIVTPTRELAKQITKVCLALGDYMDVDVYTSVGGTRVRDEIQALRSDRYPVVVGTPGRIFDMINREALNVSNLKTLILDEADQMVSDNFQDIVKDIIRVLPADIQICLLSATMPPEAVQITERFMRDPVRILVKREEVTVEGIRQYYIDYEREEFKLDAFEELYGVISVTKAVVFVNRRRTADNLKADLEQRGHVISCIHGDMDQHERNVTMQEFRSGSSRILIATDIIARGIDVQSVNLVINYDLPEKKETYIHRIGRSGRFGRKGTAINFVCQRDSFKLREIEQYYDTHIEECPGDVADKI